MALPNPDTPVAGSKLSVADRVVDAARMAAHLSHEARLLKSVAEDTIEDGVRTAKRTVKKAVQRSVDDLRDVKDDAIRGVKRRPLVAVAAAFGIGLAAGTVVALVAAWTRRRATPNR
jgi:hypothetical protein